MKSMTGFGFASGGGKDYQVEVSIKAGNSRFTDIKFYTPLFYFSLEKDLKNIILETASRGQWIVRINRFPDKLPSEYFISWDIKQARKWKTIYKSLAQQLKIKEDLDVKTLARSSGVVSSIEKQIHLKEVEKQKVRSVFKQALKSCLEEKRREGLKLRSDILKNLNQLSKFLSQIQSYNAETIKEIKKSKDSKKDDGLERSDIHEEIVRTQIHIKNFKMLLYKSQPMGKKLDFYTQELLREINTIGSKSQKAKLTSKVIDSKFSIEKIREQVQNLE